MLRGWLMAGFGALILARAGDAQACAPAPPAGEPVRIADEEAIIAWDAAKQRQHFIRRASFRASGRAFGFLVPSPTKPELGEVDGRVFQELAEHLRPRVIHEEAGWDVRPGCMFLLERSAGTAPGDAVRVLGEARVAGFDAVILAADDPGALSRWLAERGFAEGPALVEWLAPYVAKKWILTAFKVADPEPGDAGAPQPPSGRGVGTSAVRMTFTTDRPFYPYREPADQREVLPASHRHLAVAERMLRVHFVSDQRFEGALGDGSHFPGRVKFAGEVTRPPSGGDLPERFFLTTFEDESNPRPGTDDVFFAVAKDQAPVEVAPIVLRSSRPLWIPLDLLAVVAALGAGVVFLVRRRRRARGA